MRRLILRGLAFAFALAWPGIALACPDCDVSRAARSAVLGDPSLVTRLASMALPIAVTGIVAAVLYRVGARGGETSGGQR